MAYSTSALRSGTLNLAGFHFLLLTLRLPEVTCRGLITMARQKLSKTVIEGIAPGVEDIVIWDAALPGFGVRVKPTGVRSYIVQYRSRETGASKRLTMGQHGPLLTLEQAKKQARGLLSDAMRGKDPVAERRTRRNAPTMADLATDYLDKYAGP